MKKLILICMALLMSCSHSRPFLTESVRYVLHDRIDTVYVTLPSVMQEIVTPDSTSVLENAYAQSSVSIDKQGMMHHALSIKPTEVPALAHVTDSTSKIERIEQAARISSGRGVRQKLFCTLAFFLCMLVLRDVVIMLFKR